MGSPGPAAGLGVSAAPAGRRLGWPASGLGAAPATAALGLSAPAAGRAPALGTAAGRVRATPAGCTPATSTGRTTAPGAGRVDAALHIKPMRCAPLGGAPNGMKEPCSREERWVE